MRRGSRVRPHDHALRDDDAVGDDDAGDAVCNDDARGSHGMDGKDCTSVTMAQNSWRTSNSLPSPNHGECCSNTMRIVIPSPARPSPSSESQTNSIDLITTCSPTAKWKGNDLIRRRHGAASRGKGNEEPATSTTCNAHNLSRAALRRDCCSCDDLLRLHHLQKRQSSNVARGSSMAALPAQAARI